MKAKLIAATLLFSLLVPYGVQAAQPTVEIDGKTVVFPDAQPKITEGRVLVPLRGVFENLGFTINWNQESKTAKQVGDIDVYKAAHHGYVTFNNHQDAINAIKPEYTIITNTPYKARTTIKRVKKANKKYKKTYYTVNGTIKLQIDANGKMKFSQ